MKRRRSHAFSHRRAHFCLTLWEGLGEEGSFEAAARSHTPRTSCQNLKRQLLRPCSGPSKAAHSLEPGPTLVDMVTTGFGRHHINKGWAWFEARQHIPEQLGWKNNKYWANIEKKINLIPKTIGNRKGDCAWSCSRWQTQPETISKLQSTNQYNERSEWHCFVRCNLQIFSGCVCHLEQLHAQSPFLFPIVFGINSYFSSRTYWKMYVVRRGVDAQTKVLSWGVNARG